MAEEVQIAGADSTAKIRNPLGVLGLTLITLGIYFFFWWYFINREMKDLGQARGVDLGQKPGNSVWAVTPARSSSSRRSCPSGPRAAGSSAPRRRPASSGPRAGP